MRFRWDSLLEGDIFELQGRVFRRETVDESPVAAQWQPNMPDELLASLQRYLLPPELEVNLLCIETGIVSDTTVTSELICSSSL